MKSAKLLELAVSGVYFDLQQRNRATNFPREVDLKKVVSTLGDF